MAKQLPLYSYDGVNGTTRPGNYRPAKERYGSWNDQTRLMYDSDARRVHDQQSVQVAGYGLHTPMVRDECFSQKQYAATLTQPIIQQRQTWSPCGIVNDSQLRFAPLTQQREINQLFTRPYLGVEYMGAGRASATHIDMDSDLTFGDNSYNSVRKSCNPMSGLTIDRFHILPEYGNPQRVDRVVEPWVRGGEATRDLMRQLNHQARSDLQKVEQGQACLF